MYVPSSFAQTDAKQLMQFIEAHSFGTLYSSDQGRPSASHLPLLLDRSAGPRGTLLGHMARANPQWKSAAGQTVLVVFSGPHAYISPTWYQASGVVPTWNYVAVHGEGVLETIDDTADVIDIVRRTVEFYEGTGAEAWTFDPSADYIRSLAAQIVAFRIPIARLEGKWKLSQNQPRERQEKVAQTLTERDDENSQQVAAMMRAQWGQVP